MTAGDSAAYVVVDASVSLKWALDDEESVSQAIALRDAALDGRWRMVAPSLWVYEVMNGLLTAVRRQRLAASTGLQALGLLQAVGVRVADPEAKDVYEMACQYRVAAYNAAYLALAATLRADLWTGDRRLYEAVRDSAGFVRWIGDYPLETEPAGH